MSAAPKFFASLPGPRTGARILSRDTSEIGLLYPQTDSQDLLARLNSHDELLAALKDALQTLEAIHECEVHGSPAWLCARDALPPLRAALKAAWVSP